jgi:uncharacterized Zn-finger protein
MATPSSSNIVVVTVTEAMKMLKHKRRRLEIAGLEGHDKVTLHQCAKCEMSFLNSSNLKKHLLTHDGIKTFQCGVCNKTFRRRDHL